MTGDPDAIHADQFLPHPPAKVWRALTEPDLLARWLMPGDFRLEIGHRYTMRVPAMPGAGFSGVVEAEVLAFTVPEMLRVRWSDAGPAGDGMAWTITWTLRPEGRGTRLFLMQEGADPGHPLHARVRQIMDGGWRTRLLPALTRVLAGTPDPMKGSAMSDIADRYTRLSGDFLARIEATPADRWDRPSPCEGWTARDVVAHVVNGHRGIVAMARGTRPQPGHGVGLSGMGDAPEVHPDADLAAAFAECRANLLAVLADRDLAARPFPAPIGLVPLERAVDVVGALELLVHTWDLARAVGGDQTLDAEAVARTHEALLAHYDDLQATGAFLPRLDPPPGADAQAAFLAFTGRQA
ncbi:hypothetical protein Sru01_54420 [Sphaerisporangium rufum]|uniref:TIGR03086 family protein n=1 Tax=Sphaerisporangium rufum TaxID=1381558 RepID=A0A919V7J9_9ACTN|nr:TIGR03086 family metal-binding protein [Sphaerisporangium rufum]GII80460.1 hypothetical protein Sru01_54420 [Sphaerisporangium rufum]